MHGTQLQSCSLDRESGKGWIQQACDGCTVVFFLVLRYDCVNYTVSPFCVGCTPPKEKATDSALRPTCGAESRICLVEISRVRMQVVTMRAGRVHTLGCAGMWRRRRSCFGALNVLPSLPRLPYDSPHPTVVFGVVERVPSL
jgi:hypothetical protein